MKLFMNKLPLTRPIIQIQPQPEKSFMVTLQEAPWMYCLPEVGAKTVWGIYDQPDWKLTDCTTTQTLQAAEIHGIDCVQVKLCDYSSPKKSTPDRKWNLFIHTDADQIQLVASSKMKKEKFIFETLLDESFFNNWGPAYYRTIQDAGFAVYDSPEQNSISGQEEEIYTGAGIYTINIGEKSFDCLRVLNRWSGNPLIFSESYVSEEGRTVLFRRYNHPDWRRQPNTPPWDEKLPDAALFYVNGQKYVHWYDTLSDYVF